MCIRDRISGPRYHQNKLKFIQLSKVDERKILIVTVVEGNIIKNAMADIAESLSDEEYRLWIYAL